jgi:hypothetical protein
MTKIFFCDHSYQLLIDMADNKTKTVVVYSIFNSLLWTGTPNNVLFALIYCSSPANNWCGIFFCADGDKYEYRIHQQKLLYSVDAQQRQIWLLSNRQLFLHTEGLVRHTTHDIVYSTILKAVAHICRNHQLSY